MAPNPIYQQVPHHRYVILRSRYDQFLETLNDPDKDVVKIFDTLSPKQLEELELIRGVTKELQEKKDEDIRKAAQAAAEEASKAEAEKAKEEAELKEKSKEENGDTEEKPVEPETAEKVEN